MTDTHDHSMLLIEQWRPARPPAPPYILGYADVTIQALGVRINGVSLSRVDGQIQVFMPRTPRMNGSALLIGSEGRPVWDACISFASLKAKKHFFSAVVDAVTWQFPEALA